MSQGKYVMSYMDSMNLPSQSVWNICGMCTPQKRTTHNWSFERKTYTWSSRKSSHSMKSGGFHPWNPYEIRRISPVKSIWNPLDFTWNPPDVMKSVWNPPDFERQLPGMVSPMFMYTYIHTYHTVLRQCIVTFIQRWEYLLLSNVLHGIPLVTVYGQSTFTVLL